MNTLVMDQSGMQSLGVRELTNGEVDQVSGGILPAIGVAIAVAGHVGVGTVTTSLIGHLLTGAGLGLAVFGAASYYGSGGGTSVKNKKVIKHY